MLISQRKQPLPPVRDGLLDYRCLIKPEGGQLALGGRGRDRLYRLPDLLAVLIPPVPGLYVEVGRWRFIGNRLTCALTVR
jgi:hypothetical protein